MKLNRRHKAILFVTLLLTGTSLLAGFELREGLGMAMLGIALAWSVGSDAATRSYLRLVGLTNKTFVFLRLQFVMIIAGLTLGAILLFSKAHPVLSMIAMGVVGIAIAPFTELPTQKLWLRVPLMLAAPVMFFLGVLGILVLDSSSEPLATRMGELTAQGFMVLLVGVFWLSRGWKLLQKGMSAEPEPGASSELLSSQKPMRGQYVSLFLGILTLGLWLALLSWGASSDWAHDPAKERSYKPGENVILQIGFILLLTWWPFGSWKSIIASEPNSKPEFLRRHRRVAALCGSILAVLLCAALTFGTQNGNDRVLVEKIKKVSEDLKDVGARIRTLKSRDLQSTYDYVETYAEVESLLPEFDSQIERAAAFHQEAVERNRNRGSINIQRLYSSYKSGVWEDFSKALDLVRKVSDLTKEECAVARRMKTLSEEEQLELWENEFKPLLEQEDALREDMLSLQQKIRKN